MASSQNNHRFVRDLRRGIKLSYYQNKRRKWNPPSWRFDTLLLLIASLAVLSALLW